MMTNDASTQPSPTHAQAPAAERYRGQVVYLYAYDVAYDLPLKPLNQLLGQPALPFVLDADKRSPRQTFFYRPQMVRLPPIERPSNLGLLRIERTVKILPVGAISLSVVVPFQVERIEDLVAYHEPRFAEGSLHDEVRRWAGEIQDELARHCLRPVSQLAEEEAYTVFCLQGPVTAPDGTKISAEKWLQLHRRPIAALLTQETDVALLSDQEARESTSRFLSYYEDDVVVIDWDAALLVDDPSEFADTLYVMELGNVHLAELEAYDRLLDQALDRSYRDVEGRTGRGKKRVLSELREIRIDLARFTDELSNITKFFGDWHLARIYQAISARFHLPDWHQSIDGKLKTLDELYEMLKQDQTNRWMLILESTIVLLFVVDLLLLFSGSR